MSSAPEIRRSTTEFRRWDTWAGSLSEIERVANLMQTLAQQRLDAELALVPALEAPESDSDWLKKRAFEERAERRAELAKWYVVETRLTTGNQTIEGAYRDVSAEFDYRTFSKLELYLAINYRMTDKMYVAFQPRLKTLGMQVGSGVALRLESDHIGWEKQAMAQISEELDAGRSPWAWLRTWWGTNLFPLFMGASLGFFASAASAKLGYANFRTAIGMFVFTAVFAGTLFSGWPMGSLFPPVEIHREGAESRSRRAIAFILGVIVVPVAITVALNLL